MRRLPIATRLLSGFLLWTALRSVYAILLGQADSDYRLATEAGYGSAVWVGEGLYAFLAAGGVAGIWVGWRKTVALIVAALAVSTSLLLFQLQQMEADPVKARESYAASRRARGFPATDQRLESMFSPSGRRLVWAVGAVFAIGPLALLLWRRDDFVSNDGTER